MKAIVVVHPNNPTGHATHAAERARLEEICARHGLALIVDEVFLDYPIAEDKLRSFAVGTQPVLTFCSERDEQDLGAAADEGRMDCGAGTAGASARGNGAAGSDCGYVSFDERSGAKQLILRGHHAFGTAVDRVMAA